jgi:hypothetical protein
MVLNRWPSWLAGMLGLCQTAAAFAPMVLTPAPAASRPALRGSPAGSAESSAERRRPARWGLGCSRVALAGARRGGSSAPEIRTIDISPFFRDDPAGRALAGEEVRRACEEIG